MNKIITLEKSDKGFHLSDGFQIAPRAYLAITNECPPSLKAVIRRAVADGYVKLYASIYEHEHTFNLLKDQHEID